MKYSALLIPCLMCCGMSEAQVQRPNVIMLMADQLRYAACGYAGDAKAITPNIDRLANQGIDFHNYVVNTPVSAATRATLWTGKYASTHGMIADGLRMNPNHDTLGHLLNAKGYVCDYIGPWNLWDNQPERHEFPENAFCPPGPYRLGFNGFWAADNFNPGNFHLRETSQRNEVTGRAPALFTDMAINRLERHAETQQPFAMVVSYAMTAALDEQVGHLLQSLEASGLAENTIVILTSAQGEPLGANTRVFTTTFFDRSARVPMLMRWPGKVPAGRRSNACISAVDIMPTICGMLGVGFPDNIDGIDLSDATRVDCSCEPDFAFLQGMGHMSEWKDGFEWRAVRDQRFTYAHYLVDGEELLLDSKADPEQSKNLINAPEFASDVKRLRQWMSEKMLAINDEFQPCTSYRDEWTESRVILRGARGEFHREMADDVEVTPRANSTK